MSLSKKDYERLAAIIGVAMRSIDDGATPIVSMIRLKHDITNWLEDDNKSFNRDTFHNAIMEVRFGNDTTWSSNTRRE